VKRREFIMLLGGAAVWPLAARAQQPGRVRRIGVLMNLAADDPEGQVRLAAFLQGLQEAQIDIRWGAGDAEQMRKQVTEMVALAPDVILASSPLVVVPLRDATRTIPIVATAPSCSPARVGLPVVRKKPAPGTDRHGIRTNK
jgi:putative ABC transport system substrate-binding protein